MEKNGFIDVRMLLVHIQVINIYFYLITIFVLLFLGRNEKSKRIKRNENPFDKQLKMTRFQFNMIFSQLKNDHKFFFSLFFSFGNI